MSNNYFQFKEFTILQTLNGMKVCTDSCIFGAWVSTQIKRNNNIKNVLDLGTGTGLLSLMIAQKNTLPITSLEIDENNLNEANYNFKNSKWSNQIQAIHADCRDYQFENLFDCIISNPPFFENDLQSPFQDKNKAKHNLNLNWQDLLKISKKNLSPKGCVYILCPQNYAAKIKAQALEIGLHAKIELTIFANPNKKAIRTIFEFGLNPQITALQSFYIHDNQRNYTQDMKSLLKDYYFSF